MIPGYLRFGAFQGRLVHLGVCGSVSAYKALELSRDLMHSGIHVSATLTAGGQEFLTPMAFRALGVEPVYSGLFNPEDDVYGHLLPAQNAHAMAIVPATANIIAKMAHGLADDMLSCQALAFDRPRVVAPAMNPAMWRAAATQNNVAVLRSRGDHVLDPDSGRVACGDEGQGRLPDPYDILMAIFRQLSPQDLSGQKILVTLGPTREYYDPVRFWSNPSSGKMGAALAIAAWLRGAEVHCVCGPNALSFPQGIHLHPVLTSQQMFERCLELWPGCDTGCLCAAVADFRPESIRQEKLKKDSLSQGRLTVDFAANPDILRTMGASKRPAQQLIGFAAETCPDMAAAARSKLEAKNLDLIVANRVTNTGCGFASDQNQVLVCDRAGTEKELPPQSKGEVAWSVWDWISKT